MASGKLNCSRRKRGRANYFETMAFIYRVLIMSHSLLQLDSRYIYTINLRKVFNENKFPHTK